MLLTNLTLTHFRSHGQARLKFSRGVNLIVGPNGVGKTNLLEAAVWLVGRRMSHTRRDEELIQFGTQETAVCGQFEMADGLLEVDVKLRRGGRRIVRWNGITPRQSFRTGPAVVLFTPDDLALVKGPAEDRRRFLDEDIGLSQQGYQDVLSRLGRVLQQRNAVLRGLRERSRSEWTALLRPWDEALAPLAVALSEFRAQAVARLAERAARHHADLAVRAGDLPKALRVTYVAKTPQGGPESVERELLRRQVEEVARGYTLVGPHRDDLDLHLDGREARAYASQGEQRSIAVSLKLAALDLAAQALDGDVPLLFLDDVLSELDPARQEALWHLAKGQQTLVTATSARALGQAAVVAATITEVPLAGD